MKEIKIDNYTAALKLIEILLEKGLCLLPILLEMISTGRVPPCSEPTTGLSSA